MDVMKKLLRDVRFSINREANHDIPLNMGIVRPKRISQPIEE
jgi:hypothetical protein